MGTRIASMLLACGLVACTSSDAPIDDDRTAEAVDRAAAVASIGDDVDLGELRLAELALVDALASDADSEDRVLDGPRIARAWLATTDDATLGNLIDTIDDSDGLSTDERNEIAVAIGITAALSPTVRDELSQLAIGSPDLDEIEAWLDGRSPGATVVSAARTVLRR